MTKTKTTAKCMIEVQGFARSKAKGQTLLTKKYPMNATGYRRALEVAIGMSRKDRKSGVVVNVVCQDGSETRRQFEVVDCYRGKCEPPMTGTKSFRAARQHEDKAYSERKHYGMPDTRKESMAGVKRSKRRR